MKKTYYFTAAFFCVLFCFSLSACSLEELSTEQVTFVFPQWPPQDSFSEQYPQLDEWFIQIEGPDISEQFYISSDCTKINLPKNIPCSVTATPVTEDMLFFHPAGTIYPYYANAAGYSDKTINQTLTWECGFSSVLMQKVYKSGIETTFSSEQIQNFQKNFNWKKCQDSILAKINGEQEIFYNPWQIDEEELLNTLCSGTFSLTCLNVKNVCSISLESTGFSASEAVLSPYIPENSFIDSTKYISVKKNNTNLFMYNKNYGMLINCSSSKKVSVEYTYLPIFYRSYETLCIK